MNDIWERFNGITTADAVKQAMQSSTPIEEGIYEVTLLELKGALSQTGLPMIKGSFLTADNRKIWYNQSLQNINYPKLTEVNIANTIKLLNALSGEDYEFDTVSGLVHYAEAIPLSGNHKIKVSYATKDLDHKFPIITVVPNDEPLPFDV